MAGHLCASAALPRFAATAQLGRFCQAFFSAVDGLGIPRLALWAAVAGVLSLKKKRAQQLPFDLMDWGCSAATSS
ncbi:MAG: hypothetical protein VX670_07125 [Candidatus Latescibacterota bacterium]|nr:hypothetical protein [Candidatus Latescibacterota bacterium]